MELFLLIVLVMIFFFLYEVYRDDSGNFKIKARYYDPQKKNYSVWQSVKRQLSTAVKSKLFYHVLAVGFVLIELLLLSRLIKPVETLIKVRASQLLPQKFTPIARFAANIDWDSKTVDLDASMSKAYQDKITNFIWRIDDGTSLVGEKNLTHTFKDPGYYYIQLSIVDADNQSDVATCQILIPPQELEQVPTHERLTETVQTAEKVKDVDFDWAPKGTFFNYSKMAPNERSYANLKSHYIESGCGYSNKSYNTLGHSYIDFIHDSKVQAAFVSILRNVIVAGIFVPVLYVVMVRFFRKVEL